MHRPLYSITVGELGVTTKQLETSLQTILELAANWNAVLLLDEGKVANFTGVILIRILSGYFLGG